MNEEYQHLDLYSHQGQERHSSLKQFLFKNQRILFYGGWLLLSLLQAYFTQLQDDEAYYWVYSKYLAWGYFDHPPMIAFLIKLGTYLLPGELGVRLLPVLLNTLMLWITEKLIEKKNHLLFYAICLTTAALQISGFWAVPDIPLMFFTAVFFYCYQSFIKKSSWANTLLLAIATALLLYSKYHGVLVILFTLFSNGKLFKQYKVYIAGIIAFILFLPHLWWQYQHNWISFRYQLFENKAHPYQFSFTLDYLGGQFLVSGPITGIILLVSTFFYKPKNLVERALKHTAIGIFAFFLLSSLRGQVEANWTAPALIPMLVLTHNYLQEHKKWRLWLLRLTPVTIILVLLARVIMIADILPVPAVVEHFHSWKKWPQQLKEKTEGLPLVFNNSYQRASMCWFYTGQMTYSLNSYQERVNNYNYWPVEDSLLGKPVYILDIYNIDRFSDSLRARLWTIGFSKDSQFHSFAKVALKPDRNKYVSPSHSSVTIHFTAIIPVLYKQFLEEHMSVDEPVKIGIFKGETWIKDIECPFSLRQLLSAPQQQVTFIPGIEKGKYYMIVAIGSDSFFTHNSDKIGLEIVNSQ